MSTRVEWRFYVYAHYKTDTGELFYIGKGANRNGRLWYQRARGKLHRSDFWKSTVKRHGFRFQILCHCAYARLRLGSGTLREAQKVGTKNNRK